MPAVTDYLTRFRSEFKVLPADLPHLQDQLAP